MTEVAPNEETETTPAKPARKPRMATVELLKNYRPDYEDYEVVGYRRPAVKRKNAAGKEEIVQPEEFVEGQVKPPAIAGTGFPDKLWAGTFIRIPVEEARIAQERRIAEVKP